MWLITNRGFLSIVQTGNCAEDELLVRARRRRDIAQAFPKAKITESTLTDYRYRAVVKRDVLAAFLLYWAMEGIKYPNFKDSIEKRGDEELASAAHRTWSVLAQLQPTAPYAGYYQRMTSVQKGKSRRRA